MLDRWENKLLNSQLSPEELALKKHKTAAKAQPPEETVADFAKLCQQFGTASSSDARLCQQLGRAVNHACIPWCQVLPASRFFFPQLPALELSVISSEEYLEHLCM